MKKLLITLFPTLLLAACGPDNAPTTADKEQQAQTQLTGESIAQVGMPAITNFAEKRNYKMIYELRDNPNYATYTYLVGMHNELKLLCHSVGYGIPESSQYTASESEQRVTIYSQTYTERLPQADPNGLYSSPSSQGTWVMCVGPDGKVVPVRSEPNVLTTPYPME
jgi:hypothetical protein